MSGVNAHVIAGSGDLGAGQPDALAGSSGAAATKDLYRRQRLWPLPPAHPLLVSAAVQAAAGQALFCCAPSAPSLAYLWQQRVGGHATLPAAAVLELLAAAGVAAMAADALASPLAVLSTALTGPVHLASSSTLTLAVNLECGEVQLLGSTDQVAAVAQLAAARQQEAVQLAQQPRSLLLGQLTKRRTPKEECTMATLDTPAWLRPDGYLSHPAVSESSLALVAGATSASGTRMVRGCAAYLPPNQLAQAVVPVAAVAISCDGAISLQMSGARTGQPGLVLEGLDVQPLSEAKRQRAMAGPAPPAWQLAWQPTDLLAVGAVSQEISCMFIGTAPSSLAMLCDAGVDSSGAVMAGISTVWSSNAGTEQGTAAGYDSALELCVSSEVHLVALLGAADVQRCAWVQPADAEVDVEAALAAYRCVLSAKADSPAAHMALGLITFDCGEGLPGSAARSAPPSVGLLQGLARTLFMEARSQHVPSVDLSAAGARPSAVQLATALAQPPGTEFALAFRGGRCHSLRLLQAEVPRARPAAASSIRTAIVSGGTKGLGLEYARQLAASGARLLVLASRSGCLPADTLREFAEQARRPGNFSV